MAAAKREALITPVATLEEWEGMLGESEQEKLLCIDIHNDWSGPCEVCEPHFRKLWADTDGKVKFVRASRQANQARLKALCGSSISTATPTPTTTTTSSGSKKQPQPPQQQVAVATEAAGPTLEGCKPLFFFVKNRVVVGRQEGIDILAISSTVQQHLSIK